MLRNCYIDSSTRILHRIKESCTSIHNENNLNKFQFVYQNKQPRIHQYKIATSLQSKIN